MNEKRERILDRLIDFEIESLGRIYIKSEEYTVMDTILIFSANKNDGLQFTQSDQDDLIATSFQSSKEVLVPTYCDVSNDDLEIVKYSDVPNVTFPFKVKEIMEFWVGRDDKAFLFGGLLYSLDREQRLFMMTETDEIRVYDWDSIFYLVKQVPFDYGVLSVFGYGG
ncbi:MAG: hypothetical protein F6K30_07410 [Cyanothece sp. SIO2G6]|nr:hypothetical protein [Cyanothece sp. SIO2G6]